MSSRNKWIAILVVAALVAFVIALFGVQNWSRTAELSLDLYFVAFKTQQPIPLPALIAGCTLGGFLVGFVWMWLRSLGLARKVRQLEQQAALSREPGDAW